MMWLWGDYWVAMGCAGWLLVRSDSVRGYGLAMGYGITLVWL